VLINTHMLMAARDCETKRYIYSCLARVYAADTRTSADVMPLKESDAYPAIPEDGHGWEKLFSERICDATRSTLHNEIGKIRWE
jgi:nucleoside-diphosphate-sugar epimerase